MKTIELKDAITKKPDWAMAEPVDFVLDEGEHIAIVGRNGAGKSMLVDMITGRHPSFPGMVKYSFDEPYNNIRYITFRDTYGGDNDRTYFLQQRWNQMEIDEETPTVGSKLEEAYQMAGEDTPLRRWNQKQMYKLFQIDGLLDKYIVTLSSGELRKFKLVSSLFTEPRVLIIDNPFIGLDAQTRDLLREMLKDIGEQRHLQIILVVSREQDIPDFITHVVEVSDMVVRPKVGREAYLSSRSPFPTRVLSEEKEQAILGLSYGNGLTRMGTEKNINGHGLTRIDTEREAEIRENPCQSDAEKNTDAEVIRFNKVSIRYGSRTILKDLDWTVMKGERWSLSGQNGSGKSTLLSLVCADNPQSYACDIRLFGKKRGSGESIWDIKRRIGYVSPEMHRSYRQDIPAIRIVASGLKDSVGLYFKPKPEEYDICRWWMDIFGLEGLCDRNFLQLSSGEQRLMLLARAFVKDPELLILDEPLHGLDNTNRRMVKDIIEAFCQRPDKTLIFVTHYQEELPNVIDHSLFLKRH